MKTEFANSILVQESSEYFYQISSILIILSYRPTVSKLVHFLRQCISTNQCDCEITI